MQKARKQAQIVACMAGLPQCGILLCTHADEHEGGLVDAAQAQSLFRDAYDRGSGEAIACPAAPRLPTTKDPTGPSSLTGAEYFMTTASYGYNAHLRYERYTRLIRPARIPLVFDALREAVAPGHFDAPPAYDGDCWGGRGADRPEMKSVCIDRHQGTVNALFLDWAARKVDLKELWTLKWGDLFETDGLWTIAGGVSPADWPPWMRKFKDY